MRLYEGNILTCDKENRIAHYLLEDQGKILYCGDELPAGCVAAERVSTGEGALIPPFVDSHIHFASYATFHAGLNVMNAQSNEEILQMLREHVKKTKEKLVIGFGASPYSVSDGHLVRRVQLDEVCPDKPLFLVKYDGHACVVNTVLLNEVRGKVQHLRGFHEDTGDEPGGIFRRLGLYHSFALYGAAGGAHAEGAGRSGCARHRHDPYGQRRRLCERSGRRSGAFFCARHHKRHADARVYADARCE